MNQIFIEEEFFNLNNSISYGLISGCKKLSEHSFNIFNDVDIDEQVNLIFKIEGIKILKHKKKSDFNFSIISSETEKSEKYIVVNKKTEVNNFGKAVDEIIKLKRHAEISRVTSETKIEIELFLDGSGKSNIQTGIGFFDHMLEQISKHANLELTIFAEGDLHVDEHHTVEDVGIALGEAILKALGDKRGLQRYGFLLPMDDSIAECAVDLGGRAYLNFNCEFNREKVGEFPTELVEEFFRGLSQSMKANIYIRAEGKNDHHKIEGIFKAFAKALNDSLKTDSRNNNLIPSTKGVL